MLTVAPAQIGIGVFEIEMVWHRSVGTGASAVACLPRHRFQQVAQGLLHHLHRPRRFDADHLIDDPAAVAFVHDLIHAVAEVAGCRVRP